MNKKENGRDFAMMKSESYKWNEIVEEMKNEVKNQDRRLWAKKMTEKIDGEEYENGNSGTLFLGGSGLKNETIGNCNPN